MSSRDLWIMAGTAVSMCVLTVLALWLGGAFDGWLVRHPDWRVRREGK